MIAIIMHYLIDAHSHIQFPVYDSDRDMVIKRAQEAGVKMLAVGMQASTSESAIQLAHKYSDDIWATVGFHPTHATHARTSQTQSGLTQTTGWFHDKKEQREAIPEKFDIKRLRELALDKKVVAIGECGLDYYRLEIGSKEQVVRIKDLQKEVFLEQAKLAQELNKPLMIHCRPSKGTDDAYEDLIQILDSKFQIHKIVHFYVGSSKITKKLVEAGFYFTFGGVITFAKDYDESIKYIPLDRILLETDCPYVAPQSQRGKRNEPAFIVETAQKAAEIKNIPYSDFLEQISKNALTAFRIKF